MTAAAVIEGGWVQIGLGLVIAWGACLASRLAVGSAWRTSPALIIELLLPSIGFALIAASSARPLFAGITVLVLGAGYGYADRAKRKVLAEPIVFTDVFQAFDIFRHPRLALPFPRLAPVLAGALAGVGFFVGLLLLEPPVWQRSLWHPLAVLAILMVAGWMVMSPLCRPTVAMLRRLKAGGDPHNDSDRFGPLAMLLLYGVLAHGERAQRRAALSPIVSRTPAVDRGPLVLVQAESFFDARRLHPSLDSRLLPNWRRLQNAGAQSGRLRVPSWGANTVRTEFSVLTGLPEAALGCDRFNPYHRFVSSPIDTLAWRMRDQGYRTICLHPFDRRFYGRNRVMPHLGFDVLIGEEAFSGAARVNGFVADVEVARQAAQIIADQGPKVFLFIITMENHGPWQVNGDLVGSTYTAALDLPVAERRSLERYLGSLNNSDAMLNILCAAINAGTTPGVLALYGDHLPAFQSSFARLGLNDLRSDYLIHAPGCAQTARKHLSAENLSAAVYQTWLERIPARMSKFTGDNAHAACRARN